MRRPSCRLFVLAMGLLGFAKNAVLARAQFPAPLKEELTMTSQPDAPDAPAIYLDREEDTEDTYHTWSKYVRLKVLTEGGLKYGTVELRQYQGAEIETLNFTVRGGYTIKEIEARTIHPDGTIVPFTGKVEERLIERNGQRQETAKVFSLPEVTVGSILEYRYKLEYNDHLFIAPTWVVQTELYTRKAHFLWRPSREPVVTHDEKGGLITSAVAWTPILPKDAVFTHETTSGTGINAGERGQTIMELKIQNVPPAPREEFMPPAASLDYRVLFYYTPYLSGEQFWKLEGGRWSSARDEFIGPGPKITAAAQQLVTGSSSEEERLRRIYAAVQQIENLTYTHGFTLARDREHGIEPPKSADELWERKAGHSDEIAEVFVALARAAGMKAYVMGVANRRVALFMPNYLSLNQLHDYIAVVSVDGREVFFDPGEPRCPYGQLHWNHASSGGLRQIEGGTKLTVTPTSSYKDTRTQRVANLTLDDRGVATGTVKMTWTGAEALRWRQGALRGDELSLQRDLASSVERMLPRGLAVSVSGIQNLDEYEKPLIVTFDVKGALGSATGKRLLLPADVFEANATPSFPHEKRQVPVYLPYPYQVTDAIRIGFAHGYAVETMPAAESLPFQKSATYSFSTESSPTSVTARRDLVIGNIVYPASEYSDLRSFYSKFESKDKEPAVLKLLDSPAPGSSAGN